MDTIKNAENKTEDSILAENISTDCILICLILHIPKFKYTNIILYIYYIIYYITINTISVKLININTNYEKNFREQ